MILSKFRAYLHQRRGSTTAVPIWLTAFRLLCVSQTVLFFVFQRRSHINLLDDAWNILNLPSFSVSGSSHVVKIDTGGSSTVERSDWPNLFFPLCNVCVTATQIHFFQDPKDRSQSGIAARDYFEEHKVPPEIFIFWGQKMRLFNPKPHLHQQMSMQTWMEKQNKAIKLKNTTPRNNTTKPRKPQPSRTTVFIQRAFLYNGTSFIVPPHLPHNMFHLFNDLVIPLFQTMMFSGSMDGTNLDLSPKKQERHLFLLNGNPDFMNKRVIMFDVLEKLFDSVNYPMSKFAKKNRAVCFERYIWTQKFESWRQPYYSHVGRFDDDRDQYWEGVLPALRDKINEGFNIQIPNRPILSKDEIGKYRPTLVWASRTGDDVAGCTRCIVNEEELLERLKEKFDVHLLPIMDRRKSRDTNLRNALEQMAVADMLGGLHGAGLGHGLFLQPGAPLFEIKDRTRVYNHLFRNMANLNDAGYYAFDARPYELEGNISQRFLLNASAMDTITDGLWEAWQEEAKLRLRQQKEKELHYTPCQFPEMEDLNGKVSSFNMSRCYLIFHKGRWVQNPGIAELKSEDKKTGNVTAEATVSTNTNNETTSAVSSNNGTTSAVSTNNGTTSAT